VLVGLGCGAALRRLPLHLEQPLLRGALLLVLPPLLVVAPFLVLAAFLVVEALLRSALLVDLALGSLPRGRPAPLLLHLGLRAAGGLGASRAAGRAHRRATGHLAPVEV